MLYSCHKPQNEPPLAGNKAKRRNDRRNKMKDLYEGFEYEEQKDWQLLGRLQNKKLPYSITMIQ